MYFPRNAFRQWQACIVDSRGQRMIGRVLGGLTAFEPPACTVGELLFELPKTLAHNLFEITLAEEKHKMVEAQVRGRLTTREFEIRKRQLAALFLSAGPVGVEGDVCMLDEEGTVGYGISVAGGSGTMMKLSDEQIKNASLDPDLDVISGYFHVPASLMSMPPSSGMRHHEVEPESSSLRPALVPGQARPGLLDLKRRT
jgi:hypothetical protein